ncbi:MAG TPA: universal stress protein [Chroococcales cyanobacterium]|jgi:nucleotide-binding universal stress UspA family protein
MKDKKQPNILVPLDGSLQAHAVLPVASRIAKLYGATLHVVYVGEPPIPPDEVLVRLGFTPEEAAGLVFNQLSGAPPEEAKEIVRLAEELHSLFIALSTHTKRENPRGHLGSVAGEILRTSHTPLIFVQPERGRRDWELKNILFPDDGSPATVEAIQPAVEMAHQARAEMMVLYVINKAESKHEPGSYSVPRYMDHPQYDWPAWASEFLGRMRGLGRVPSEIKTRLFLAKGQPGAEIVRFSQEHGVDLIVLAWHGKLEREKAATMKEVIRHADCPVLVLRVALPV